MLDDIFVMAYIIGAFMVVCFLAAGIQNVRDRLTKKESK